MGPSWRSGKHPAQPIPREANALAYSAARTSFIHHDKRVSIAVRPRRQRQEAPARRLLPDLETHRFWRTVRPLQPQLSGARAQVQSRGDRGVGAVTPPIPRVIEPASKSRAFFLAWASATVLTRGTLRSSSLRSVRPAPSLRSSGARWLRLRRAYRTPESQTPRLEARRTRPRKLHCPQSPHPSPSPGWQGELPHLVLDWTRT